ncbi:SPRY domain-containing protein [uncultured Oceanicoccus sp.]|uniref:DUF7483 domain-containing protein n=1 Tax=uncultured Oceanicoccus sp. TaxID=1706381 RepID=UPI0030D81A63
MDIVTYDGNGGTQNIGGLNFEPGLVWLKTRTGHSGKSHGLFDVVRGPTKFLSSDSTADENSSYNNNLTSFNPDGFTIEDEPDFNTGGRTYVGWCWRAGGPAVANDAGSITSQVSANTDYGFSIIKYTGVDNSSAKTIGHGLGKVPKLVLIKNLTDSEDWAVYHASLGNTKYLQLNSAGGAATSSAYWNDTDPTSSLITLNNSNDVQRINRDYIVYAWSEVSGYSKFGSYTGNGSDDGPFIETGFKPRWILIKSTSASNANSHSHWLIYDTERSPTNEADDLLLASGNNAEFSGTNTGIDILDNGFKLKADTGGYANFNTNQYIYAAFADRPGNNWDVNNIVTNEGLTTSKTQFDVVTYTGNGGTNAIGGPVYSATSNLSNPANVFDGDTSTGSVFNSTGNSVLTAGSMTITSSLEIFHNRTGSDGITVNINGTNYTATGLGSNGYHTIPIPGSDLPLTTTGNITIKDNQSGAQSTVYAVRVDSSVLVDGTGPGLKFQPDLVWIKNRNGAHNHMLFDVVRGAGADLMSNATSAESSGGSNDLTSFDSSGFSLGSNNAVNQSTRTYVAWCWKAGGTAVSNTDGSITSSVSANAAYGFSIVSYSGNSVNNATIGHGLNGKVPKLIITKNRSAAYNWITYSSALAATKVLALDATNAAFTPSGGYYSNVEGSTYQVVQGSANLTNLNNSGDDYIAYCFADVPGYQRIGSYTGNGSSTGPVVVTGFKPRFLLVKNLNASRNWVLWDTERANNDTLKANSSGAEESNYQVDALPNGFQIKNTWNEFNENGATILYLAIGDDEIGSDEDCLVDVPNAVTADADATDTTGGYQRGNYAAWNPLDSNLTHSNGNLDLTSIANQTWESCRATIGMPSGKFYWEVTVNSMSHTNQNVIQLGIGALTTPLAPADSAAVPDNYVFVNYTQQKYLNGNGSSYGNAFGVGDVVGVAFDADNGTLTFYINGVSQGVAWTGLNVDKLFAPVITLGRSSASTSISANFGQMRFKYPIPTGYAALNTTAMTPATIADGSDYFQAKTFTGNGGTQSVSDLKFSPDFLWFKNRTDSSAAAHRLFDTVRGASKTLFSNLTNDELEVANSLTSFDSNGFTVGSGNWVNGSGDGIIAWAWDAGSSTVSNTDGSITSSVRANQSAGFSIIAYTGNGSSSGSTVGHGLGATPDFLIVKSRDTTYSWTVWHNSFTAKQLIYLNHDYGIQENKDDHFNNTLPTNQVFSLRESPAVNSSGDDFICYAISAISGYSAVGSYTGDGTDQHHINLGFRPAFVLIKRTDTGAWVLIDSARSPTNEFTNWLRPNESEAESTNNKFDLVSNGFVLRKNDSFTNQSTKTFIYIAFAENPFQANGGLAR